MKSIANLGFVGSCIAAAIAFVSIDFGSKGDSGRSALRLASTDPEASEDLEVVCKVTSETTRAPAQQPVVMSDTEEHGAESAQVEPFPDALDPDRLQTAFEDSLFGHVDPNVFLQVGLALAEHDADREPLQRLKADTMRYPLLDMPEGMRGELRITEPIASFGSVRSYALTCEPPEEQYYLEGAIRLSQEAKIGIWTNPEGSVQYFSFTTQLPVSNMSSRLGIPTDNVPLGLQYTYNVDEPLDPKITLLGYTDGSLSKLTDSLPVVKGPPLSVADLERLSAALLSAQPSRN